MNKLFEGLTKKRIKEIKASLIDIDERDAEFEKEDGQDIFCWRCEKFTGDDESNELNCARGRYLQGDDTKRRTVDIMFIGEAPGAEEVAVGQFFVGPSGRELNSWIKQAGINTKKVYFDNALRCSMLPGMEFKNLNSANRKKIVENCKPYLFSEIERLQPKVIVLLGNVAMQSVLGISTGIMDWQGRVIRHREFGCYIVPVLHPSYVLRNRGTDREACVSHLNTAKSLITKPLKFSRIKDVFIQDYTDFDQCMQEMESADEFVLDIETIGLDRFAGKILGIALCANKNKAYFLPTYQLEPVTKPDEESTMQWNFDKKFLTKTQEARIKKLLKSNRIKIMHNSAFDINWLEYHGIEVTWPIYDSMIVNSMVDKIDNGLKPLALIHTDFGGYADFTKEQMKALHLVNPYELSQYACYDAIATYRLAKEQKKQIRDLSSDQRKMGLRHTVGDIIPEVMQLRRNLCNAEALGCRLDINEAKKLRDSYISKMAGLDTAIKDMTKVKTLSLSSHSQVSAALYDNGQPLAAFAYSMKRSTDKKVLDKIRYSISAKIGSSPTIKAANQLKLLETLAQYRVNEKLVSTYLNPFVEENNNGRVYTSFSQHVVRTGRLSSRNPNLQNIPRGEVRNCFIAEPGHVLVDFDYGQIELRIAAEYSQDPAMLEVLNDPDGDIHSQVGVLSFRKPDGSLYPVERFRVEGEPRAKSKIISFSVVYGKSLYGLSQDLGVSESEAAKVFSFFFSNFSDLKRFIDEQHEFVEEYGFVDTIFGRRLYIDNSQSWDQGMLGSIQRRSVNYPIQSAAGDALAVAFNRAAAGIKKKRIPADIILTVHDSILFNVKKECVDDLVGVVKEAMESPMPQIQHVRLFADYKVGRKWGTMKKGK